MMDIHTMQLLTSDEARSGTADRAVHAAENDRVEAARRGAASREASTSRSTALLQTGVRVNAVGLAACSARQVGVLETDNAIAAHCSIETRWQRVRGVAAQNTHKAPSARRPGGEPQVLASLCE